LAFIQSKELFASKSFKKVKITLVAMPFPPLVYYGPFTLFCQLFSSKFFIQYFTTILARMSHNVLVVYDVLTAAIKKPRSGFNGGQNVPTKNRSRGYAPLCGFS
jgi:hypothetical protein